MNNRTTAVNESRLDQMLIKLRDQRFRLIPQRLAVLEILAHRAEHPSAAQILAEILRRFPTTSLARVYKTVLSPKVPDEVQKLGFTDGLTPEANPI